MSDASSPPTKYYTICYRGNPHIPVSPVAWVPKGESQVTTYGGGSDPNTLWELQSKGSSNYLEEGYYILRNLGSGKFARTEDNTGNIIVGDELIANKFYLRLIDPSSDHWKILESADSTLGWTISATSPIVVLRDIEKVGLEYGRWGIIPLNKP